MEWQTKKDLKNMAQIEERDEEHKYSSSEDQDTVNHDTTSQ